MDITAFLRSPRSFQLTHSRCTLKVSAASLLLLLLPVSAAAQDGLFDYQEYEKRVKSSQGLSALKADTVLGDRTSAFDGATEFTAEDVSLPGNADLSVRIARRFGVESSNRAVDGSEATGLTLFDDWEIDVPSLSGVWTNSTGWVTAAADGALTNQRCTNNRAPTLIEGHGYYDIGFGIDVRWDKGSGEGLLIPEAGTDHATAPGLDAPKWITASRARFTCLATTRNGYPGEGFVGHTADGKKFYFDWGVEKPYALAQYADGTVTRRFGRKRVYLLASRVEDRFGNWVNYNYTGYRLNSVEASDGRRITLAYDGQGRVSTVTANGRVWRYAYTADTNDNDAGLSQVTLPDGSRWTYSHTGRLRSRLPHRSAENGGGCQYPAGNAPRPTTMTVTSPSATTGVFEFEMNMFLRSDPCNGLVPSSYDVWSMKRRTLSGPGLAAQVVRREYNLDRTGTAGPGRWVNLIQPDGVEIRERYGTDPASNERKLLQRRIIDKTGQVIRDESNSYVFGSASSAFPQRIGRSLGIMSGQFLDGVLSALSSSSVSQDGDAYSVTYSAFDRVARPTVTTQSGPSGTRSQKHQFYDSATPWVLDLPSQVTELSTGIVTHQYVYNALAKPVEFRETGRVKQKLSYASDGTISQVQDALGNTVLVSDWYRGVPRLMTNPDGSTRKMEVDDNGWITAEINELGLATRYQHDTMGRTREIHPPQDAAQWAKTFISIQQVPSEEYGIAPGHWRVISSHGAAREETYLDALWQPLLVRSYDSGDVAGTQTFIRKAFDSEGREIFSSYPARDATAVTGEWTEYDALGRKTSSSQDSEKGLLITTQHYTSNTSVVITDPRGHQSTTRYEAFGMPDYSRPLQITRPDGSKQTTIRNVFGSPVEISQSAN
ncbi:sugar-binding protein [Stenotrophomonas maltophilia]|uniref:sugar-binding protein n=1 Tax=Stenotrophomonas maltophilia TaxID=40324 RepID=UPI0039C1BD80